MGNKREFKISKEGNGEWKAVKKSGALTINEKKNVLHYVQCLIFILHLHLHSFIFTGTFVCLFVSVCKHERTHCHIVQLLQLHSTAHLSNGRSSQFQLTSRYFFSSSSYYMALTLFATTSLSMSLFLSLCVCAM